MSARIGIEFDNVEGAVIRLLGLIERRGFVLRGVTMAERDGDGASGRASASGRVSSASMTVELVARDPSRRLDVLELQLRRLHGVRDISTNPLMAGASS